MSHVHDLHDLPTGPPDPDQYFCRTALLETSRPEHRTVLVAAHGELDAANGAEFVDYVLRHRRHAQRLVVDLSGLTFFATAGFSALHTLNVQCVRHRIRWALVSGPSVQRVLRICDPDAALPVRTDVADALAATHDDPPRLLQLVPESG